MKLTRFLPVFYLLCLVLLIGLSRPVLAASPTLTVTSTGNGDSVNLSVTGTPNSSVLLYYTNTNGVLALSSLGLTTSGGTFNTTLSSATYSIKTSNPVHVAINNQASPDVVWPSVAAGNVIYLNQTSLILALGQSSVITASNNGTSQLYLANNSNPLVANVNVNGSQISVSAISFGSTMVTLCAVANTSSCASAYVTVQNSTAKPLSFSQNAPGVLLGQTTQVLVAGGTGTYVILANTNPTVVSAVLSGATVSLSTNNTTGSAAITVCSSDISSCGVINASVGIMNGSPLVISQTNPSIAIGQFLNLTITGGGNSTYSIFNNSNPAVITASLTGNTLNLYAQDGGSATITVCSTNGSCGTVTPTVTYANTGGQIRLSQNNLWLSVGQNMSITILGGAMPYSLPDATNSIAQASLSGSTLTLTGQSAGSINISVCSASGGCTSLAVLVNGTGQASQIPQISLSPSNISVYTGQNAYVSISGNGGYYVASQANSIYSKASITNNVITISGLVAGNNNYTICQTGGQCATLAVAVNQTTPDVSIIIPTISTTSQPVIKPIVKPVVKPVVKPIVKQYKFSKQLVFGSKGTDVTELQKRLKAEGYYKGPTDGKFLTTTVQAVKQYQKKKGLKMTGNVGLVTLGALNKLK